MLAYKALLTVMLGKLGFALAVGAAQALLAAQLPARTLQDLL